MIMILSAQTLSRQDPSTPLTIRSIKSIYTLSYLRVRYKVYLYYTLSSIYGMKDGKRYSVTTVGKSKKSNTKRRLKVARYACIPVTRCNNSSKDVTPFPHFLKQPWNELGDQSGKNRGMFGDFLHWQRLASKWDINVVSAP